MRAIVYISALYFLLPLELLHAGDDEKDRERAERRLRNLETRANGVAAAAVGAEHAGFLQRETRRLLKRCREHALSSYEFDRLLEAMDDLLDVRDDLHAAARQKPETGTDKREETEKRSVTAKRLERAYFRVQQAEYFARLSAEKQAPEYITLSRQIYQRARAAYDARDYGRAMKLASASGEMVNVLENLAQAAVRRPEPPILK
ncbi:MAG TPA: hypothetical protein VEX68_20335 [Bryobacteraceae bacterium]|nr:hypothetical protein [Bryobacteraceae bacterium]